MSGDFNAFDHDGFGAFIHGGYNARGGGGTLQRGIVCFDAISGVVKWFFISPSFLVVDIETGFSTDSAGNAYFRSTQNTVRRTTLSGVIDWDADIVAAGVFGGSIRGAQNGVFIGNSFAITAGGTISGPFTHLHGDGRTVNNIGAIAYDYHGGTYRFGYVYRPFGGGESGVPQPGELITVNGAVSRVPLTTPPAVVANEYTLFADIFDYVGGDFLWRCSSSGPFYGGDSFVGFDGTRIMSYVEYGQAMGTIGPGFEYGSLQGINFFPDAGGSSFWFGCGRWGPSILNDLSHFTYPDAGGGTSEIDHVETDPDGNIYAVLKGPGSILIDASGGNIWPQAQSVGGAYRPNGGLMMLTDGSGGAFGYGWLDGKMTYYGLAGDVVRTYKIPNGYFLDYRLGHCYAVFNGWSDVPSIIEAA